MNIKTYRLGFGLSQAKFARSIGVSPEIIKAIEQGRRNLTKKTTYKIYRQFEPEKAGQMIEKEVQHFKSSLIKKWS